MSKWLHRHSNSVKHFCARFSRVYSLVFLFDLEDEGTTFLWKDDKLLQNYTTSDSRRWEGLFIGPLWEPQLWLKASLHWKIIWVPPVSVAELGLLATASSGTHLSTPPTGTRVSGPWDEVTGQDTELHLLVKVELYIHKEVKAHMGCTLWNMMQVDALSSAGNEHRCQCEIQSMWNKLTW